MNRWLLASWLLIAAAFGASFYVNAHRDVLMPEKVPIHWGIDGKADGWANRADMFWWLMLPPLLMVGCSLLAVALPWLSPKPFSLEWASRAYQYVMFLIVAMFGLLHAVVLLGYCVPGFQIAKWLIVAISLFFMLLGNVLGQIPRNFWIGVRTPWTLANNVVWVKTHRLAAWLFVADGFICAILALIGAPFWLIFAALIGIALVPVGYSLWLYKRLERTGQLEPT